MTESGESAAGFRTLNGYRDAQRSALSASMEDYLEMIGRLEREGVPIRIGELARRLHVAPSSASKMAAQRAEGGFVDTSRYGSVTPTEYGRARGQALLTRHDTVHRFLCRLCGTGEELEQTEKIEHFLAPRTVEAMARWLTENGDARGDARGDLLKKVPLDPPKTL